MANSFQLITKFLPKAVDKYFAADAKTAILENGSKFVDVNFNEAGYVKIADILLDGLSDYYRTQEQSNVNPNYAAYAGNIASGSRDGFAIGGVSVRWEIFKLQYCRGKQIRIDYISNEETANVIIGHAVEEFMRLKVVPEVDATRFSIIAGTTSLSLGNQVVLELGGSSTDALTDTNTATGVMHRFNAAFEWLADLEVPEEEQIIFVRPAVNTLIHNTAELAKFITQSDYRSAEGLTFKVEKYFGRPIIEVPSSRFFTDVVANDNGYTYGSGSKLINFMICSAKAVVPIRKLEHQKVYGPEQSGLAGFYGYLINVLIYHGVVVPKNKVVGVYCALEKTAAPSTKVSTLSVDIRAGSATNTWYVNNYFTRPQGLRGMLVYAEYNSGGTGYAKDGFAVGGTLTGTAGTDYVIVNYGGDTPAIQTSATATAANFALVDASGKIIASVNQVALVKGA